MRPCQQARRVLARQSGQKVMGPEITSPYDHINVPPSLRNGTLFRPLQANSKAQYHALVCPEIWPSHSWPKFGSALSLLGGQVTIISPVMRIPQAPLLFTGLRLALRSRPDGDIGQPGKLRHSCDGDACVFFVPVSDRPKREGAFGIPDLDKKTTPGTRFCRYRRHQGGCIASVTEPV